LIPDRRLLIEKGEKELAGSKLNNTNRTVKGSKSLSKPGSSVKIVSRTVKSPPSVNKAVKSPSSVNRELSPPSSMNRETGIFTGAKKENREADTSIEPRKADTSMESAEANTSIELRWETNAAEDVETKDGLNEGVNSVQEYLNLVDGIFEKICRKNSAAGYPQHSNMLWFRGVKSAAYSLIPRIARNPLNTSLESVYLSAFKAKALPYLEQIPAPSYFAGGRTYWEWLFLMHHYGVPTRILDWTLDALAALVFATMGKSTEESGEESAVWCLEPLGLNRGMAFHDSCQEGCIPCVEEPAVNKIFGPGAATGEKKPCAVSGPVNSIRIIAQKGAFMVFPQTKRVMPLNEFPDSSGYLFRILINKHKCSAIAKQLRGYGFTEPSLFPDLSRVVREITIPT